MASNSSSTVTAAAVANGGLRGAGGTGDLAHHSTPGSLTEKRISQNEADSEKNPKEEEHEYVTGVKLIFIIISVTLVYFLVMLDGSIVSTAIPQITSDFDSLLDVGWYGSAYQLASSACQPLSGKIYTYFNTKASTYYF
jgi:hypothetical protein